MRKIRLSHSPASNSHSVKAEDIGDLGAGHPALNYIKSVARQYVGRGQATFYELVQAGLAGLEAAERCAEAQPDEAGKERQRRLATWWVRQAMIKRLAP